MLTASYALIKDGRITEIVEIPVADIGRAGSGWARLARKHGVAFVSLPQGGHVGNEVRVNRFAEATVVERDAADSKTAGSPDGSAIPAHMADRRPDWSNTAYYCNHEGVWQYVEPSQVEHYRHLGHELIAVEADEAMLDALRELRDADEGIRLLSFPFDSDVIRSLVEAGLVRIDRAVGTIRMTLKGLLVLLDYDDASRTLDA